MQKPVLRKNINKPSNNNRNLPIFTGRLQGFEQAQLAIHILEYHDSGWMTVTLLPNGTQKWPDGFPHKIRTLQPKEVVFSAPRKLG